MDLIRSLKEHLTGGVKCFGIVSDLRPYLAFENIGDRNTGMAMCTPELSPGAYETSTTVTDQPFKFRSGRSCSNTVFLPPAV